MRPRLRFKTLGLLAAFAAVVNCGNETTSPLVGGIDGGRANGISFRPSFPAAYLSAGAAAADLVPFTNVRVVLRHSDGTLALDTLVNFPSTAESLELSLNVRLLPGAPSSGEPMSLTLNYQNAAGVTVFTGGPVTVLATQGALGQATSPPVTVPIVYSGPGANAAKVVITPKTQSVFTGSAFQFTAQALDASNNVIANTPIVFSSSNPSLAAITNSSSGTGTAGTGRGSVQISATLLTGGLVDAATLTIQPVATAISVTSGSGQSATVGSALAQPVIVKVVAADGLGVSGVPVVFAPSGGGSVSPASATTDASGNAQTSWTLGNASGAQTLTVSATGFPFTATATATANPRPATRLAIVQQPANGAINTQFSVSVAAQDANGGTATSFTGAVTLALGSNAAGATLGGTTTVNAVGGVATFSGLTLNRVGTGYTLVASSGALTGATTNAFDVIAGAPSAIAVFSGANQTAPQNTVLPQPITVSVTDASGNAVAGVTVQFAPVSGSGSVSPASALTDAQGRASTVWTLGTTVGTQSIAAVVGTLPGVTINATATSSGSGTTQLVLTGPASVTAGSSFTTTVTARDNNGNVVTTFNGTITLAFGSNPAGGTLSGNTTANAVNGVATFSNSITKASNSYTLVASTTGATSSPAARTVTAAAPTTLAVFSGGSQTGTVSQPLPAPVVVALTDTYGNGVSGQTVTFFVPPTAGGSVSPATSSTDANGQAATTWTLGFATGTQSMTVSAAGVSPITVTANAAAAGAGSATSLEITSSPISTVAGSNFSLTVRARDANNQTATSFTGPITVSFGSNPANGTLSGTTTLNAVNGVANFTNLSVTRASPNYTIIASASSLTAAAPVQLDVRSGPGASVIFSTQPSAASANAVISPAPVVSVVDSYGNVATSYTGNVTVAIGNNAGGGQLTGTTTVAAVNGVATFSNLKINFAGNGYTLAASSGAFTTAISSPFNVNSTAGSANSWTNASGGSWSTATNWSLGRVPVNGDSVVIALPGTYTVQLDTTYTGTYITLGGSSGSQTLSLIGRTLTLSGVLTVNSQGNLELFSASIAGTGAVNNQGTLSPKNSVVVLPITNSGTIISNGQSVIDRLNTTAGSSLRLRVDGTTGQSLLTVNTALTNLGQIELTSLQGAYTVQLLVPNGLTNSANGIILSNPGGGGSRAIIGPINNQGSITLNTALNLANTGGASVNSGTIDGTNGNLDISASNGGSFTNNGIILNGSGKTFTVTGGSFTQASGATLNGGGAIVLSGTTATFNSGLAASVLTGNSSAITFAQPLSTAGMAVNLNNSTVQGAGTITNAAGQTLTVTSTSIGNSIVNNGTIIFAGAATFGGAYSNNSGSLLKLEGNGSTGQAFLTITNGFTNNGTIDITSVVGAYSSVLNVTNGTLINASGGGVIQSSVGAGGNRAINAVLDNRGSIVINQALSLVPSGNSAHTNSGTIAVSQGDFVISMQGASSFTNTGTITVGASRSVQVFGGSFVNNSGASLTGSGALVETSGAVTLNAGFALTALTLNASTLTLNTAISTSAVNVSLFNSDVLGTGSITNVSGHQMTVQNGSVAVPVTNQGMLVLSGTMTLSGAFSNASGGTMRLQGDGSTGTSNVTVSNGFTNSGTIDLTTIVGAYSDFLNIGNNSLINAPGAIIISNVGAGGARTITGQIDNQGTITVNQALNINLVSRPLNNSGSINVSGGDLQVSESGGGPSFTNSNTLTIAPGRTATFGGGTFAHLNGAVLNGGGAVVLNNITAAFSAPFTLSALTANASTVSIAQNISTNGLALTFLNTSVSGAGSITNAASQTLAATSTTIANMLTNDGTIIYAGSGGFTGAFTNNSGATLRLEANGSTGTSNLTVASGFTNSGTIDLTTIVGAYSDFLTLTSGTLINAVGGTIVTNVGAGGSRTINAQINNQGTITLNTDLSLNAPSQTITNAGTINVTGGNLLLSMSGTSPSFTNNGTLQISPSRTATLAGGTITQATTANITGGGNLILNNTNAVLNTGALVSSLAINASTVSFAQNFSTTGLALSASGSTINGAGAITNDPGQTVTAVNTTVANNIANNGTIVYSGTGSFTGAYANNSGSILRLQGDGSTGTSNLTFANGFTNAGIIDLTTIIGAYSDFLTVTNGTLANTASGTIQSSVGAGGSRSITARISNQGTIAISHPLSVSVVSGTFTNAGSINVSGGDLAVSQSGTAPAFTNNGSIAVNSGRTLTNTGGAFNENSGGTLNGGGALSLISATGAFNSGFTLSALSASSSAVFLNIPLSTSGLNLSLLNSNVFGSGSITNAASQLMSITGGSIAVPLSNQGEMVLNGSIPISSAVTNSSTGILRLRADGSTGNSSIVIANGFVNDGLIDLTSTVGAYSTSLAINSGTLTNSASGTLQSSFGAGGTRTLNATVNNQGTINVGVGGTGTLLFQTGSLTNSGTINIKLLSASDYDRIQLANGSLTLGGILNVSSSFNPPAGTDFQVLTGTSRSGVFSTTNVPSGFNPTPNYSPTTVTVFKPTT